MTTPNSVDNRLFTSCFIHMEKKWEVDNAGLKRATFHLTFAYKWEAVLIQDARSMLTNVYAFNEIRDLAFLHT